MINIIHSDIHCNDNREITAIEVKLKSFTSEGQRALLGHPMITTASAAFYKTTLLTDVGEALNTSLDPKRQNDVVDMKVVLKKNNHLSFQDVANFLKAFQEALDTTDLGF